MGESKGETKGKKNKAGKTNEGYCIYIHTQVIIRIRECRRGRQRAADPDKEWRELKDEVVSKGVEGGGGGGEGGILLMDESWSS